MASGESVEMVGEQQAMADLKRWAEQLGPDVTTGTRSFAETLAAQVTGQQPVLTGALAASVKVVPDEGGNAISLGEGLPYAGWIEFGGSRGRDLVPDGRTVYPTALRQQTQFADQLDTAVTQSINRFHWSSAPT